MPMLKAVLFDVDGTMAETEEFHRQAFNGAFADLGMGIDWSPALYRELLRVTGGKERLAAYFRNCAMEVPEQMIRRLHAAKNARYGRMLREGAVRLRPGVVRLMAEAESAGVRLGIATTTSPENLDVLLRSALAPDWARRFACIVAGDQVARKKPAPDVFLANLERLGIYATEAVAIEDSQAGIAAARNAHIAVVATPSQYTLADDFSGADVVAPHLGEPQLPWEGPVAGLSARWIRIEDLQRLVSAREIAPRNEVAQ